MTNPTSHFQLRSWSSSRSLIHVIAAIENPQNPHAKEVLRQHKAVQRGDRSVVISFLEEHVKGVFVNFHNCLI